MILKFDDFLNEAAAASMSQDIEAITPYYEIAKKALEEKKIKAIMDSPIVSPKGYAGDVYFTIVQTKEHCRLRSSEKYKIIQSIRRCRI